MTADEINKLAESLFEHIKHGDDEHRAWLHREAHAWCRAALRTEQRPAPDGWKLVPVEPTEEMLRSTYKQVGVSRSAIREIYAAMLATPPSAPAASSEDARDAALVAARGWIKGICAEYNIGRPFSLFDQIDAAIAATPEAPK